MSTLFSSKHKYLLQMGIKRNLLFEQLDQKLQPLSVSRKVLVPESGWINTILTALKMTIAQPI